ncbi:methyl-accepting chemotaxis protein [Bacillus sp. 1P06AnD]|uniref:methyl-accepting chemotaxis protein n=1 Tax=Bacillus sp. 1P06AnD TaxID=3132208 RepID=UPI0039A221B5
MKRLRSLRAKVLILCILILLVPSTIIGRSAYMISKQGFDESGRQQLKDNTQKIIGMITLLNNQVNKGYLSLEDAQEELRTALMSEADSSGHRNYNRLYTVGKSGNIFAMSEDGTVVMSPDSEGANLVGAMTEDKQDMGKTFLEKGEKGGFAEYTWKDPRTKKVAKSIAYIEKDPYWGWTVGSDSVKSEFNKKATSVSNWIAIITLISIIIGGAISYWFAVRFTKPLRQISGALKKASNGDFSEQDISVQTKDEVGELAKDFNTMKQNMHGLLSTVKQSTFLVASSSEQLTASSEETKRASKEISEAMQLVATGAESNNTNIVESATSLEEVTIAIQNLAENASSITTASDSVIEQAKEGNHFVRKSAEQVRFIQDQVNDSNSTLQLLISRSKEIGEISTAITSIADQTNLLSLNAAIEAARAGEHGRGFAVVADEVRKLAEQSQNSSQKISEIINDVQVHMGKSTGSMNAAVTSVEEGLDIINQTEAKFEKIVQAMGEMGRQVTDVAATVEQMSAGAEEVSAAFTSMTSVTKDTSTHSQRVAAASQEQQAAMEEISRSSTELSQLSTNLQKQVDLFKI